MKFRVLALSAVMLCASVMTFAQEGQVTKKHNFGLGLSSKLSGSTNNYLKGPINNFPGLFGNIDKNLDLSISAHYEYAINRNMYLGTGLTYMFNRMELTFMNGSSSWGETSYNMHDIEIPLYFDYKFPIMRNINLFGGVGVAGMINLSSDENIITKDTFSPYLLLRAGFDILSNHRLQFVLQYHLSLNNNYQINTIVSPIYDTEYKVNIFDIGFNFYF
jgi:hypothetical protein